jgi:hypothetical protein
VADLSSGGAAREISSGITEIPVTKPASRFVPLAGYGLRPK